MTIYDFEGNVPEIHESVFVAEDANIIGKIKLNEKSSVWFCSTLRGDNELISVGFGSNIQENCVLHTDIGFPLTIGKNCTMLKWAFVEKGTNFFHRVGQTSIFLLSAKSGDTTSKSHTAQKKVMSLFEFS